MTIRFIENVSKSDIILGHHYDPGPNSMLIQIMDPAEGFPTPKYKFKEVHQFEFMDIEDDGVNNFTRSDIYKNYSEAAITQEQANNIIALLQKAIDNNMNVIVHCHAGIFRSGAVVEVSTIMGFTPVDRYRDPNRLVKYKLMNALGIKSAEQEIEKSNKYGGVRLGWEY